jgi:hypothetical protein
MKMAVESMEMAPGVIPHPDRVPEQRLLSPELRLRWRRRCGTLSGKKLIDLGFSCRRDYIGGGAISEGTRGPTPGGGTTRGGPTPPGGVATSWPPSVSALDSVSCRGNRNFGLCFVQFQEYFLCNFSKTQKIVENRNWHCGILLIG